MVANHPNGPFVCSYCSASRKKAHESDWAYFTRCSHILSQFYKHVHMCETDGEAVVGCGAAASAFYLHFASRLCSANATLFVIPDLMVIFIGFPSFSELFVSKRESETENWYYRSLLSFHFIRGSDQLLLQKCSPFVIRDRQRNVLFSSPSMCCCCATLDWAQWALEQAQARREEREGKKTSRAQWKASVLLPQLNLQMNSLHCPSHRARRRITRADLKQRGTVERAEPGALHGLYSEHFHLPSFVSSW